VALAASSSGGCGGGGGGGAGSTQITGSIGCDDGGGTSPGTTSSGIAAGTATSKSLTVNGQNRTYVLYTPSTYDGKTPFPVILAFHGDGGDGASLRAWFNLEPTVAEQAIIVYPDGINGTWDIDDIAGLTNDVAFVDAILADLNSNMCIAQQRLYATGISRGAYFTNQMVCRSKNTWRAIVTHAGGGPYSAIDADEYDSKGNLKCTNQPLAALQVHGDADDGVAVSEGMKSRSFWCDVNGCQGCTSEWKASPDPTQPVSPSPCMTYAGCSKPEVWCEIPGLGHTFWDQAPQVTWGFFSQN